MAQVLKCLSSRRNHFESTVRPVTENPLDFWSQNCERLGFLLPLVRTILAIPASSASVERNFSNASFITDGRDNLAAETVERLSIIRHHVVGLNDEEYSAFVERLINYNKPSQ